MPQTTTTIKSPFKFLDAYDKEDKDIFFGRTQETLELYDRIYETNLVLLYGASGTGKTSLINCGLGNQFESTDWHPIFIRRKDNIMESLRHELHDHAIKKLGKEQDKNISISKRIQSLYLDYFKPIYLIFDQFEELFIMGNKEEQATFFEMLYQLLEENLQCKILISMREEYIAYLSEFENIVPSLFDNRLRVEKMSAKNLQDVIVGTAEKFSIKLVNTPTQNVAEMIIDKLRDKHHQIDLANLQVYLDRLYRLDVERHEAGKPTAITFDPALIEKTGNLEDVMSLFLDEQLDILSKEIKKDFPNVKEGIPLDILFELVTDNGTKRAVDLVDIKQRLQKAKNIDGRVVDYCIGRFKEMRILRELS